MSASGTSGYSEPRAMPGRKAIHFLISLLLATLFWFFNSLSATYNREIVVRLRYNFPGHTTSIAKLPDHATVMVNTTGWHLLREQFYDREIKLDMQQFEGQDQLITNDHKELFAAGLPPDYVILIISPDTIPVTVEETIEKTVPVKLLTKISFKDNFGVSDTLKMIPDHITISGAASVLTPISYWETDTVAEILADSTIAGVVALKAPGSLGIHLSAVAVRYLIPVGKIDTTFADSSFIKNQIR